MVRVSQSKRSRQSNCAKSRHAKRTLRVWCQQLDSFDEYDLGNNKGKTRTAEENKLILLTIKLVLRLQLAQVIGGERTIYTVSWTDIDNLVADSLQVRRVHVSALRKALFEDGDVLIFGEEYGPESVRGKGSPNAISTSKLSYIQLCSIQTEVDSYHCEGQAVTNRLIKNYVLHKYKIDVHRSTIAKYFVKLGLTYAPIKHKKRTVGAYRMDLLRDYLISFNNLYARWIVDPINCDFVFVFTDESYIHKGERNAKTYAKSGEIVNIKESKGTRLILLHAISCFGPLVGRIEGVPIDDLKWSGDTPHPTTFEDNETGLFTCETMWKAESRSGDYHDNMNSEMFMKWVTNRLVPTFEKMYEGKKMILICDNAPYHHKREIGSLGSKNKQQLMDLGKLYNVEYIDIPLNVDRMEAMSDIHAVHDFIVDTTDDYCRVVFSEKLSNRATTNDPFIPNTEELRYGLLKYFQNNKPELLECQVEALLQSKGHQVLWTPPYSPDLQPIELFWAAGKNHARSLVRNNTTMKETIEYLREGWYGNEKQWEQGKLTGDSRRYLKQPASCMKLFNHTIKMANTKFIPLCEGISGSMGSLIVDENYIGDTTGLPVDMMLISMSKAPTDDEEDDF